MTRTLLFRSAGIATLLAISSAPVTAQMYPMSQRSVLTQRIAFTDITISYGRPTARGRALFGALVPWDSVWHPGADDATTITFTRDVTIEGRPAQAGSYSTWLIPRATGQWTFILSRAVGVSHTPYPGKDKDAMRVDVRADSASHLETFTYHFPVVLREDATLRVQWGTLGISLHITASAKPQ